MYCRPFEVFQEKGPSFSGNINLFNWDQYFCFGKLAHGGKRLYLHLLIPSGWPDMEKSVVTPLIALTLILKGCLFLFFCFYFLWKENSKDSVIPGFVGQGSLFGSYLSRNWGGGVWVWRGGGNGEHISFVEWLWQKKLLGSGKLPGIYFRNISVCWILHILSNKSTCKTALQQHLFKKELHMV